MHVQHQYLWLHDPLRPRPVRLHDLTRLLRNDPTLQTLHPPRLLMPPARRHRLLIPTRDRSLFDGPKRQALRLPPSHPFRLVWPRQAQPPHRICSVRRRQDQGSRRLLRPAVAGREGCLSQLHLFPNRLLERSRTSPLSIISDGSPHRTRQSRIIIGPATRRCQSRGPLPWVTRLPREGTEFHH